MYIFQGPEFFQVLEPIYRTELGIFPSPKGIFPGGFSIVVGGFENFLEYDVIDRVGVFADFLWWSDGDYEISPNEGSPKIFNQLVHTFSKSICSPRVGNFYRT